MTVSGQSRSDSAPLAVLPPPPSSACLAALPFVGPEVPLGCRNAGLASGCPLPDVERTGEEAASRLPPLWAGELDWGPGRHVRPTTPQPPSLTVAHPSPLAPWLPFSLQTTPACAHLGLFLVTWACPRRHLVLVLRVWWRKAVGHSWG